uniref:Phospholipid/glycerol acyltransferase domain-containing protein n=1 Tax=Ditylenchus dipsaci TaxID=166011 RepID=A0A915D569_9BILA
MLLTALVLIDKARVAVPTALLSCSMVPFSSCSLVIEATSWITPKKWHKWLDNTLYTAYLRTCLFVFESVSAVEISLYGDVAALLDKKQSCIVISNHQSNVDWAAITMLAARQSSQGNEAGLRFIIKDAIRFVPLFGWYTFQRGYVYVRRFGKFVSDPVKRQLHYLTTIKESFWLQIFPEGTRFSRDKVKLIEASQRFCEENNLPILEHTLTPRARAFCLAVDELRQSLDCVYDITLAYKITDSNGLSGAQSNEISPDMFSFCCNLSPPQLHMHIRKYSIDSIPIDAHTQRQWLYDRFAEKDRLLEEFYTTGKFSQLVQTKVDRLPLFRTFLPFLCFTTAVTILPLVSKRVRLVYLGTLATSPLLIDHDPWIFTFYQQQRRTINGNVLTIDPESKSIVLAVFNPNSPDSKMPDKFMLIPGETVRAIEKCVNLDTEVKESIEVQKIDNLALLSVRQNSEELREFLKNLIYMNQQSSSSNTDLSASNNDNSKAEKEQENTQIRRQK